MEIPETPPTLVERLRSSLMTQPDAMDDIALKAEAADAIEALIIAVDNPLEVAAVLRMAAGS